jgi:isopenicillin N synthase-like dioxygenase
MRPTVTSLPHTVQLQLMHEQLLRTNVAEWRGSLGALLASSHVRVHMNHSNDQIPELNLSGFDSGGSERAAFLAKLRAAAHDVGFFYLVGDGIESALLRDLLDLTRRFFALPEADKLAIEMVNSPHFRGYTCIASEVTRERRDWREQIDIGAERPALAARLGSPAWTRLQGPNQWPENLPALRPIVLRWQAAGAEVLGRLLRAFAMALGQPENAFDPMYRDEPHVLVKLIRYPGRDATEGDQGVGAHKDAGLLTLLLQDGQPGLQVESEHGWVDVAPRPGSLVVNIGELLELASDGYLRATLHRVLSPPAGTERLSAAFFLSARLDATAPILSLPRALAAQARGPERDPSNPLYREVGTNQLKGRLRSHPDVAQRHYADLLTLAANGPLEPKP